MSAENDQIESSDGLKVVWQEMMRMRHAFQQAQLAQTELTAQMAAQMNQIQQLQSSKISTQLKSGFSMLRAILCRACKYYKSNWKLSTVIVILIAMIIALWSNYIYLVPTSEKSTDKPERKYDEVKSPNENLIFDYLRHMQRHAAIEMELWDYEKVCDLEQKKYEEETSKLKYKQNEIANKLVEKCGDAPKYSPEYLVQEKEKYNELQHVIEERQSYQQCIKNQILELKRLKDPEILKAYAAHDSFKWHNMMYEEGLCIDRSKCLCEILMKPNKQLELTLDQIKTQTFDDVMIVRKHK